MSDAARHGRRVPSAWIAVVVAGVLLAAAGVFWLTGGRWFVVETPSMGTAAPVGTLVLTRPERVADLHVGDIIAFHPPTEPGETFTHRIVSLHDGAIRTRGDINGATDPWALHGRDLIGRAAVVVPVLGWVLRGLPLIAIGWLLVWGLTRLWTAPHLRGPLRLIGGSLVVLLAASRLRPFVGVVEVTSVGGPGGTSRITAVSTGVLPIRLAPVTGHGTATPLDLRMGQLGSIVVGHAPPDGKFDLAAHIHLGLLGWLIATLICALPLLWVVVVGFRPVPQARHQRQPQQVGQPAAVAA